MDYIVCRSFGPFMRHRSWRGNHPSKVKTIDHIDGPETIWKKLLVIGQYALYYRVEVKYG